MGLNEDKVRFEIKKTYERVLNSEPFDQIEERMPGVVQMVFITSMSIFMEEYIKVMKPNCKEASFSGDLLFDFLFIAVDLKTMRQDLEKLLKQRCMKVTNEANLSDVLEALKGNKSFSDLFKEAISETKN